MSSMEDILIKNAELFITLIKNGSSEEKCSNIIKLLNEGANVNESFANNCNCNTPLHIAVKKGERDLVELLLERGADMRLKNNEGKTALDMAKELNTETGYKIIESLKVYDKKLQNYHKNDNSVRSTSIRNNIETYKLSMYQKRTGTTGIKGELYETKLLSLILIRTWLNEKIDQFYLGTSVQGIGALDDICLRYRGDRDEDSVLFLQAKHIIKGKITDKELWKSTGNYSLSKYFNSYLKIRQRFESTSKDDLFQGKYEDTRCHFVIYTTAEDELLTGRKILNQHSVDRTVRGIISTGENRHIFQYKYDEADVKLLTNVLLVERMQQIGKNLFQFTQENKHKNIMRDKHIRNYHIVLCQKVINVSEIIANDTRIGSFRKEFLSSNNELLIVLKDAIFKEAVTATRISDDNVIRIVDKALFQPTPINISKLIQNVPTSYDLKNNRLEISNSTIKELFLSSLHEKVLSYTTYNEALQIAVTEKLGALNFKLPLTFGNVDFKVKGLDADNTLNDVALKIENIISEFGDKFIIINSKNEIDPSLIGNLLVFDEDSSMFKFNCSESLGRNAKNIFNKLKIKFEDLDTYRFKFNIANVPKVTLEADEYDENLAKDFLNNLWFYTRQAKEHEIEVYARDILEEYYNKIKQAPHNTFSRVQSDAIFLKIHNEVQKWWLLDATQAHYITKYTKVFDTILNDSLRANTLISILNYIYINEIKKIGIDFNEEAIQSLGLTSSTGLTIVETGNKTLTAIKLYKYFSHMNYTFIDFDYTSRLSLQDNLILSKELEKNDKEVIIIIYEHISNGGVNLNDFLNLFMTKIIVLVINDNDFEKLIMNKTLFKEYLKVSDERNHLRDLALHSQEKVLKKTLLFQGMEISFQTLMDTESQLFITADILNAISNNETIEIGKILSSSNYEQIKDYYVQRCLYRSKKFKTCNQNIRSECLSKSSFSSKSSWSSKSSLETSTSSKLSSSAESSESECNRFAPFLEDQINVTTLEDIKDTVLLMAAPGMGKSTLLTHLSIETKKINPRIWIERINLLDHSSDFSKWQRGNLIIDLYEALRFLCKTVVNKHLPTRHDKKLNNKQINFAIVVTNGILSAKYSHELDYLSIFELEIFIDCYNKGNTILIFDGFDEICPHYKNNVLDLLKCLAVKTFAKSIDPSQGNSEVKQQMWITSRPYNDVKKTLENEFGVAYSLKPFTDVEQSFYVEKYLRINLNLKDLNYQQFQNIDSLFEYMKRFSDLHKDPNEIVLIKSTSAPLHSLYCTSITYFQSEINNTPISVDKIMFKQKWNSNIRWMKASELLACWNHVSEEAMNLARTPLHMHIAVSYFETQIKSTVNINSPHQWDLDTNTFAFYDNFLETKLKKIRFEDKNHMDLQNPDLMITYERERVEFITKHKQLAFYSIFKDDANKILGSREIDAIRQTIRRIENGEEKTGLIEYVVKGVPKFVHLTFAEYLTVEYVTDLLKACEDDDEQVKKVWEFIFYVLLSKSSTGILEVFDRKINCDPKFMYIFTSINLKQFIFDGLVENESYLQVLPKFNNRLTKSFVSLRLYVKTTLDIAVYYGMRNLAVLLLTAITDRVTVDNLNQFIKFIKYQHFFKLSIKYGYNEIIDLVLDCVRHVDSKKLYKLYYISNRRDSKIPLYGCTNAEIIDYLKSNLDLEIELHGREQESENIYPPITRKKIHKRKKI